MQLADLIHSLPGAEVQGRIDRKIEGIAYDSRKAVPGGLFVAIPGHKTDGHRFVAQAIERGAGAVVLSKAQRGVPLPSSVSAIWVEDPRKALADLAARFFDYPAQKLRIIGITGTNGKTTTSYLVESMLQKAGYAVGVLGTIGYRFGSKSLSAPVTTPESLDLQYLLSEMVREGISHVVMEVSSHALDQGRCQGIPYEVGVFTNLTQDHLDYHQNMEAYFQAKSKLFRYSLNGLSRRERGLAVINRDDPYGQRLWSETAGPKFDFGLEADAAYCALGIRSTFEGIEARLQTPGGSYRIHSSLIGRYNLYNILAAWAVGERLGLAETAMLEGIGSLKRVPGRMEPVANKKGLSILVDYAHTPEALRFVLRTSGELTSGRVITVFGCGGDRDTGKRPIMGRIAGSLSHLAVITSDNPRTEDPLRIIQAIEQGIKELPLLQYESEKLDRLPDLPGYTVVPDRRAAIRLAVRLAGPGDCLLIAGKGHENYQILGAETVPFDDREEALKAAEGKDV